MYCHSGSPEIKCAKIEIKFLKINYICSRLRIERSMKRIFVILLAALLFLPEIQAVAQTKKTDESLEEFLGKNTQKDSIQAAKDSLKAAKKEIQKHGWNIGPLPCVSYNSDLGFQYGICADIFNYADIFPDYHDRMYLEASRFTGGQTLGHFQYDSKYLIPGVRTTFVGSYQYDPMYLFYGLNGLEDYNPDMDSNTDTRTMRYAYKRSMVRILADFQGPIIPHLNWIAGLSYWNYKLGDMEMDDKYDSDKTLFREMVNAGVFSGGEDDGGNRLEIKAGAMYDTRNNEAAPDSGIWAELYLNGSPDVFSEGRSYLKLAAHWHHYVTLLPDRLVFAYHLAYQGTIAGQAPFFHQQNISTLYLRQTCTDGLGGINTVRGLLAQRLVGNGYAWTNVEFRVRVASFNLINQSWYVALNPFFDAGMCTGLYKSEEMARFYNADPEELRRKAITPHCAAGLGLKLAMNRNFIISCEYAMPFKREDGKGALYLSLNYIF